MMQNNKKAVRGDSNNCYDSSDSTDCGDSSDSNHGANYVEYYLLNNNNVQDNKNVIDVFINEKTLESLINNVLKKKQKYVKKEFKVYKHNDMILENHCNKSIKVYSLAPIKHNIVDNKIISLHYEKQKENYNMFPCTDKLDSIYDVKRVTFKMNDITFLNFDTETHLNDEYVHKIFINYNIDKNKDQDFFEKELDRIIKTFLLDI